MDIMQPTARAKLVIYGRSRLKAELEATEDPQATISGFLAAHLLPSPRCDGLVELVRLMRLTKAEVYRGLLESLVKKLEDVIPGLTAERQDELLHRSFPFLATELRAIPVNLMKRRAVLPPGILRELAVNPGLRDALSKLPLAIQRQVGGIALLFNVLRRWTDSAGLTLASPSNEPRAGVGGGGGPPALRGPPRALLRGATLIVVGFGLSRGIVRERVARCDPVAL